MSHALFQNLEGRCFLSGDPTNLLADPDPRESYSPPAQYMPAGWSSSMSSSPFIRRSAPPTVNPAKMVGNYRTGTSLFSTRLKITSVSPEGRVRGKVTIPWIASNVPVKGTINADGRFRLKFHTVQADGDVIGGYYSGKMNAPATKLNGTFDWGYAADGSGGGAAHKSLFVKYGKGA